jgi:hypothetical protein
MCHQIQLSFDTTQDLIIDTAFVTQMDCGHTLDAQCLQRKLGMALVIRHSFFSDAGLKTRQAFVIVTDQVCIEHRGFLGVLFFRSVQVGQRRFDHNATRFLFLAIRPGGPG